MNHMIDPLKCNIPSGEFTALDFWKVNPGLYCDTTVRDTIKRLIVMRKVKDISIPGKRTKTFINNADAVNANRKPVSIDTETNKKPTSILYLNLPDTQFTIKQLIEILGIEGSTVNKSFINNQLINLTKDGLIVRLKKDSHTGEIFYCKTSTLPVKPVENICVKCGERVPDGQKLCAACIPKPIIVSAPKINHPDLETLVSGISNDLKCVLSIMQTSATSSPAEVAQYDPASIAVEFEDFVSHTKRCFAELIAIQKKQLLLFEQLASQKGGTQ